MCFRMELELKRSKTNEQAWMILATKFSLSVKRRPNAYRYGSFPLQASK